MEGSTAGERLLRSAEVERAAREVAREVQMQVAGALAGPVGTALAASAPGGPGNEAVGPAGQAGHMEAQALLRAAVPQTFIAVGAALTLAYAAVSAGEEVRSAGALRCAEQLLFPEDPLGLAAVAGAVRPVLEGMAVNEGTGAGALADDEAAALVERRVAAEVEELERGYLRVAAQVFSAATSSDSWKRMTGGAGEVGMSQMGMFLVALSRWGFLVEAALDGVRHDDWVRVGAAVVAARRVTSSG
jgi:hypothetical protein